MLVAELVQNLGLTVVTGEAFLENKIKSGFVGDLLSVVMGKAEEGCAWITVQSHVNIVAVAVLINAACIIVSEDFTVDQDAITKANEEEVVILTSPLSSFALAKLMTEQGIA